MEKEKITCGNCQNSFPKSNDYRHCSNCFACTGCEIYYCPYCDERIEIKPMRKFQDKKQSNGLDIDAS
jgi:hypothetical protein